jgi:hypothetical protein
MMLRSLGNRTAVSKVNNLPLVCGQKGERLAHDLL